MQPTKKEHTKNHPTTILFNFILLTLDSKTECNRCKTTVLNNVDYNDDLSYTPLIIITLMYLRLITNDQARYWGQTGREPLSTRDTMCNHPCNTVYTGCPFKIMDFGQKSTSRIEPNQHKSTLSNKMQNSKTKKKKSGKLIGRQGDPAVPANPVVPANPAVQIKSPNQCLLEHVQRFIQARKYVDAQVLYSDMVDIYNKIGYNDTFRSIQSINKFVDCAIKCYFFTHSIRILSELEEFVVTLYNKWSRKSFKTFLDIGVGYISGHKDIIKEFGLSSGDQGQTSGRITSDIVTKYIVDFVGQKRIEYGDRVRQEEFDAFLKTRLLLEGEAISGVVAVFKDVLPKVFAGRHRESNQIRLFKETLSKEFAERVRSIFEEKLSANMSSGAFKDVLACHDALKRCLRAASDEPADFEHLVHRLSQQNSAAEHPACRMSSDEFLNLLQNKDKTGNSVTVDRSHLMLLRDAVIHLIVHVVSQPLREEEGDADHADIDEKTMMAIFKSRIHSDIPRWAVEALLGVVSSALESQTVQVTGGSMSPELPRVVINYDTAADSLMRLFKVAKKAVASKYCFASYAIMLVIVYLLDSCRGKVFLRLDISLWWAAHGICAFVSHFANIPHIKYGNGRHRSTGDAQTHEGGFG